MPRSLIGDGDANVPIMTNVQMHRSAEGKPSWWVGVAVTATVIVGAEVRAGFEVVSEGGVFLDMRGVK
jgi:hypothetical protein